MPPGDDALYWLYATARRVLANYRRSERRRAQLAGALQAAAAADRPPDVADHRVAAALARLREDERELLLLVAWEGLDAAEVARVMHCSRNAARIRLHRARRRFAEALRSTGDGAKRSAGPGHVASAAVGLEERS